LEYSTTVVWRSARRGYGFVKDKYTSTGTGAGAGTGAGTDYWYHDMKSIERIRHIFVEQTKDVPIMRCSIPLALLLVASATASPPFLEAAQAAAKQVLMMLECKDDNAGCASWASSGECQRNPGFMHGACRKSCGRCELQNEDAQHALEIVSVAVRNHHAGCSMGAPPSSQCDGSGERLSAVLAIIEERASGKALQRFIEAVAREILASSAPGLAPAFEPASPSAAQAAASLGGNVSSLRVTLSDGGQMPRVGLGTWLTVAAGLRAGMRHIDTSENYANHEEIGRAVSDSGVERSDLFLADKLSFAQSYSSSGVREAVAESLRKLRTTYLDLYMLHSVGHSLSARHEAWREMVALQREGKLRHIGVSNFGTAELRELKASFPDAPPVTLQSKFSPFHRGRTTNAGGEDFVSVAAELGVMLTAYCPLNDWPSKIKPVDDAHVAAIAARLGKTPAQVILRWGVQLGMTMLTRSSQPTRLQEAMQLWDFELSAEDMSLISGLAWLALAPSNKVASTVVDAYFVQARDAIAYAKVPRGKAPVAQPIKACDMAWNLLAGDGKVEL
jgi:diketogulonate reductase-like aldo/keto reductase